MKHLSKYDIAMIAYCFFLLMIGAVFAGHEIAMMKTDSTIRHASETIKKCNDIIVSINK
jgi:hypothetical protein